MRKEMGPSVYFRARLCPRHFHSPGERTGERERTAQRNGNEREIRSTRVLPIASDNCDATNCGHSKYLLGRLMINLYSGAHARMCARSRGIKVC